MSAKPQTNFRVAYRHKPYSQLGNNALRDRRLSLEARGALAFILSYPANWRFDLDWLMREADIGRDKARRIIRELEKCCYCQRGRIRNIDGTLGAYEYVFTDDPQQLVPPATENPSLDCETTSDAFSSAGSPVTGQPALENPPTILKKVSDKEGTKDFPLNPPEGVASGDALKAFQLYNETALRCGLPQALSLTPDRRKKIGARMREVGGLEGWKRALSNIERSAYLRGSNRDGWRADLKFLLRPDNFHKVFDGGYGNGAHAPAEGRLTAAEIIQRKIAEAEGAAS